MIFEVAILKCCLETDGHQLFSLGPVHWLRDQSIQSVPVLCNTGLDSALCFTEHCSKLYSTAQFNELN